jgi:hypothetical protein
MANRKISVMPIKAELTGNEFIPIVDDVEEDVSARNKRTTAAAIAALVDPGEGGGGEGEPNHYVVLHTSFDQQDVLSSDTDITLWEYELPAGTLVDARAFEIESYFRFVPENVGDSMPSWELALFAGATYLASKRVPAAEIGSQYWWENGILVVTARLQALGSAAQQANHFKFLEMHELNSTGAYETVRGFQYSGTSSAAYFTTIDMEEAVTLSWRGSGATASGDAFLRHIYTRIARIGQ